MKKIWFSFAVAAAMVSCSQTEMKQTTDTIKQADSLFKTAKDGFKTLDSISAIVKDSTKFNKVVVPEIEKQKKGVEEVIRNSAKSIDSVNAVIKSTTDKINRSADLIKTVDSARESLKNSKNPIDALTTISKTLEKVSKSARNSQQPTKPAEPQPQVQPQTPDYENPTVPAKQEPVATNPMVKTATMTIAVDNIDDNRSTLATELYKYSGEIVTESMGEEQGIRKQRITAKVPYKYFDEATQKIAQRMGTLRTKNIETEGKDYNPEQMCDLEITFTENSQFASNETITNSDSSNPETYKDKSSDAFMKGFEGLKNVFLFLLPFWPLLLIGGIVYYFYRRNQRKRDEALVEAKLEEQKRYREKPEESYTQPTPTPKQESPENPDDPYAKYKPKS